MLNVFITICVLMSWFSIGSMDMKGLKEQIDEIRKMEDQDYVLRKQMEDLENEKFQYDAKRTELDEKKQMLTAEKDKIKSTFDEQKKDFDAKTRDFDEQIQKLQQEKQTKLMEATLVQKGSISNEYTELIAQIDMQKSKMDTKTIQFDGKQFRIERDIKNKKDEIEVEKGKIVAAKCELHVKKLKIKNQISALSQKKIEKQTKVTKLMKEQFEMFESKIDDEKQNQIIEEKTKFLQTEFCVNIEVLEEPYRFLMEFEKKTKSNFKFWEVEDEETKIREEKIEDATQIQEKKIEEKETRIQTTDETQIEEQTRIQEKKIEEKKTGIQEEKNEDKETHMKEEKIENEGTQIEENIQNKTKTNQKSWSCPCCQGESKKETIRTKN